MPKDKDLVGTSKSQIHELDYVAAKYDLSRDQVREFIAKIRAAGGHYRSRIAIEAEIEGAGIQQAGDKPLELCTLLPDFTKPMPLSKPKWKPKPLPQPTPTPAEGGRKPKPSPTPSPDPTTPTPTPTGVACLYFNFNGGTIRHPQWNAGNAFTVAASGFTPEQKAQAMLQAQQAYQIHNVAVTDDRAVFDAAAIRQEIFVTPTSAWYPNTSYSGVAQIGSLFGNALCPAFVFTDRLRENTFYVACIMVHESGHAVGLRHQGEYTDQCQLLQTYKQGCHMGTPFGGGAQWVYQKCSNQDDVAFLTQKLGLR